MKPTVYLEMTIPSYLTARINRDIISAGHQKVTQDWWLERREAFDLYTSDLAVREASGGDPEAAQRRLDVLVGIPSLAVSDQARALARALIERVPLPAIAGTDALHIAIAAINGMDYLLTWNTHHIANATLRKPIEAVCRDFGCEAPIICAPGELTEVNLP